MKKVDAKTKEALKIQKRKLNSWYKMARNSILLVIGFTIFYTILFFGKTDIYFFFSSSLPFYVSFYGKDSDIFDTYFPNIDFLATGESRIMVITWIVFVVVICMYFLAWLYSKKEGYGWLVFALGFYLLDTIVIGCNAGFTKWMIWDYLCHALVLALLARGIYAGIKLKKISQ